MYETGFADFIYILFESKAHKSKVTTYGVIIVILSNGVKGCNAYYCNGRAVFYVWAQRVVLRSKYYSC